ncbi:MAG: hypothetical protein PVF75_09915 [Granulosicoccaceae bacterium]|jgi:hypothetical protein
MSRAFKELATRGSLAAAAFRPDLPGSRDFMPSQSLDNKLS